MQFTNFRKMLPKISTNKLCSHLLVIAFCAVALELMAFVAVSVSNNLWGYLGDNDTMIREFVGVDESSHWPRKIPFQGGEH